MRTHRSRPSEETSDLPEAKTRDGFELGEVIAIAKAIAQQRDIDELLSLILEKSRVVTGADAGSIYVLEDAPEEGARQRLRFKLSQNDSVVFESQEFVMPVSHHSVAGSAVLSRRPINIPDLYKQDQNAPHEYDNRFDQRSGYRTRSMLTVPLISAQDEVIGVIQLINKKSDASQKLRTQSDFERHVLPFDPRSEQLASALAGLAGIALENALLYREINQIFAGFVRASVQAIEQRDPTTSGHSLRVNALACELARRVDAIDSGPYRDTHFSARDLRELQYAALLHDFGKIGVRERVLVKANKLYEDQRSAIRQRIDFAIKCAEVEFYRTKSELSDSPRARRKVESLEQAFDQRRQQLEDVWRFICKANEPTPLSDEDVSRIHSIAAISYRDLAGNPRGLLEPQEEVALSVLGGTLSPAEFQEIRSHVVHTYNFLAKIPWGKSMAQIPQIAAAHHERLDGSGYPAGLSGDKIPLQSRIIAIADVYDALTARDRPYRKAAGIEAALALIEAEAKRDR